MSDIKSIQGLTLPRKLLEDLSLFLKPEEFFNFFNREILRRDGENDDLLSTGVDYNQFIQYLLVDNERVVRNLNARITFLENVIRDNGIKLPNIKPLPTIEAPSQQQGIQIPQNIVPTLTAKAQPKATMQQMFNTGTGTSSLKSQFDEPPMKMARIDQQRVANGGESSSDEKEDEGGTVECFWLCSASGCGGVRFNEMTDLHCIFCRQLRPPSTINPDSESESK